MPHHKQHPGRMARSLPILLCIAAVLAIAGCQSDASPAAAGDRQATVAARGATVMPFDLDLTLHDFQPLDDGGLQVVSARDAADTLQIAAIRTHLRAEAARFQAGDFSDPESIHGSEMPGLAALQAGAGRLVIQYAERSDGAEIRYTTTDPALVAAIHDWFEAQTSDHGEHSIHH